MSLADELNDVAVTDRSDSDHKGPQKRTLNEIYEHYKLVLFRMIVLLTEEKDDSANIVVIKGKTFAGVFFVWRLIHLLTFPFTNVFDFPWNFDASNWFFDAIEISRFDLLIIGNELNDQPSLAISSIIIGFIVLVFVGLFHLMYHINHTQTDASGLVLVVKKPLYLPIIYWAIIIISGPLYVPIMNVLLQSLRCARIDVNDSCWDASHTGIAVASVIVAIMVFGMVILSSALMIRNDIRSNHSLSMSHGRSRASIVCLETLMILCFAVASSQSLATLWFLAASVNIAAFGMFYIHWIVHPYYHTWTNSFVAKTLGIFVWAAITLDITLLFDDKKQIGGIVFFFIGSVIVVALIHMLDKKKQVYIMSVDIQDVETIYDIDFKICTIFDRKLRSQNVMFADDGELLSNTDVEDHNLKALKENLQNEVDSVVSKFSHKPLVYLFQAQMHKSILGRDHIANNCLKSCEAQGAAFDCQYFIYKSRYEMEMQIRNDPTSQGILRYLAATEHFKQAERLKEAAAYLKYRFWTELYQDVPNVDTLAKLGGEINNSTSKGQHHFKETMLVNRESPVVMREYGSFLIQFLNDEAGGKAMIERADDIQMKNKQNRRRLDATNLGETKSLFDEQTSIITISGDVADLGTIISANDSCIRMFGRLRSELIGSNISSLMPPPFSDLHDSFLKFHQKTGGGQVINTTRLVFGLHKSGFIFPVHLHVKQVSGGLSRAVYLGVIRQVQTFETEHSALVDVSSLKIIRSTAGWSRFFNASKEDVSSGNLNIVNLFPQWETVDEHKGHDEHDECFRSQSGRSIEYQSSTGTHVLLVTVERLQFRSINVDHVRVVEKERRLQPNTMNVTMQKEILPLSSDDADFHSENEAKENGEKKKKKKKKNKKNKKKDKGKLDLLRDFDDDFDSNDEDTDSDDSNDDNQSNNNNNNNNNNDDDDDDDAEEYKKRFPGLKVDTLRPPGSHGSRSPKMSPVDMSPRRSTSGGRRRRFRDDDVESRRSGKSGKSAASSVGTRNDWRAGLSRIRDLFLNQSSDLEPAMSKLRLTLIIVIFVIMFMAVLGSLLVLGSVNNYREEVVALDQAGKRRALTVITAQTTRELDLIRQGILDPSLEATARKTLVEAAEDLWATVTKLYFGEDLSEEHRLLMEKPSVSVVDISSGTPKNKTLNLMDAVNTYQSAARLLYTQSLSDQNSNNEHNFFIRANMENVLDNLNKSCNFFQKTTFEKASNIFDLQRVLLSITLAIVFVLVVLLIGPAISRVESTRREIYGMFINDIPLPLLKKIKDQAFEQLSEEDKLVEAQQEVETGQNKEKQKLTQQMEQEALLDKLRALQTSSKMSPRLRLEELMEQEQEMAAANQTSTVKVEKTRRRAGAFKFSNKTKYRLFMNISLILAFAVAFFLGTYFWEYSTVVNSTDRLPEINYSGRMRTMYRLGLYYVRDAVVAPITTPTDNPSMDQNTLKARTRAAIDFLTQIRLGLLYGNLDMDLHGSVERNGEYINTLYQDTCPLFDNLQQCESFHSGICTYGGSAVLAEYRILVIETLMKALDQGMSANITQVKNLLTSDMTDINTLDDLYLDKILTVTKTQYYSEEVKIMNAFDSLRKLVLALFIVFLCVLYIVMYAPLVRSLDTTLKRARGMLLMVPAEYIMNIPAISRVLNDAAITGRI